MKINELYHTPTRRNRFLIKQEANGRQTQDHLSRSDLMIVIANVSED